MFLSSINENSTNISKYRIRFHLMNYLAFQFWFGFNCYHISIQYTLNTNVRMHGGWKKLHSKMWDQFIFAKKAGKSTCIFRYKNSPVKLYWLALILATTATSFVWFDRGILKIHIFPTFRARWYVTTHQNSRDALLQCHIQSLKINSLWRIWWIRWITPAMQADFISSRTTGKYHVHKNCRFWL